MKIRLSDYVADFVVKNGISDCFMITGGGAMYLNDSFGHKKGLRCLYNHHEQASAMAAESYARINNKPALLCVTTGPGGTNALTGVLGAWLDSIPMFIISGQVRYDTTARYNEQFTKGYKLRSLGDQEYDITKAVSHMSKYAVMLQDPKDIRYILEKAFYLCTNQRPGPVWIDIPINFQSAMIDPDKLKGYKPPKDNIPKLTSNKIKQVINLISKAKRPVLYAGNGIRLADAHKQYKTLIKRLNIPVVTYWDSIDLIETDNPLYVGRAGNMGDRPGNFAVQNADLLLVIGNRLSIRNTGFNYKAWAKKAKVIMVDIDKAELLKPTIHVEYPIHADALDFINKLNNQLKDKTLFNNKGWLNQCKIWKEKYPIVTDRHIKDSKANIYATFDYLSKQLPENSITITSNGSCCVVGHQTWNIKKNSRFINNNAVASMGYGLPAAIGACIANKNRQTICLEGDGSIMMNLQELQTIITNKLPIKIMLINNQGYHSIRQTFTNYFPDHTKIGIGPESNDLSFPDFKKIAKAFNIPYLSAATNKQMHKAIDKLINYDSYIICEIFVSTNQNFEPKNASKQLQDGTIYTPPLEDLYPFLSEEELKENILD